MDKLTIHIGICCGDMLHDRLICQRDFEEKQILIRIQIGTRARDLSCHSWWFTHFWWRLKQETWTGWCIKTLIVIATCSWVRKPLITRQMIWKWKPCQNFRLAYYRRRKHFELTFNRSNKTMSRWQKIGVLKWKITQISPMSRTVTWGHTWRQDTGCRPY